MKPSFRFGAALVLALMVPVQVWSAACLEICDHTGKIDHDAAMHEVAADSASEVPDAPGHEHCHHSGLGVGKCCQGHTFVCELPAVLATVETPSFEHDEFVARWTSFIPERPSPFPIAVS